MNHQPVNPNIYKLIRYHLPHLSHPSPLPLCLPPLLRPWQERKGGEREMKGGQQGNRTKRNASLTFTCCLKNIWKTDARYLLPHLIYNQYYQAYHFYIFHHLMPTDHCTSSHSSSYLISPHYIPSSFSSSIHLVMYSSPHKIPYFFYYLSIKNIVIRSSYLCSFFHH